MTPDELFDVIAHLNDKYYDEWLIDYGVSFNLCSDQCVDVILFGDVQLWCSESEEREWSEELDDYEETLFDYCDRQFQTYVENLSRIVAIGKEEEREQGIEE